MNTARLDSLATSGVSFDFETERIQPGLLAPPPVCAAVASRQNGAIHGGILLAEQAADALDALLADERVVLVVQNGAFDLLVHATHRARQGRDVMPAIFRAYQQERVYDVGIAEALHAIAEGHHLKDPRTGRELQAPEDEEAGGKKRAGYRLSVLVDLVLGRKDAKVNDRFRESYALLAGVPLEQWPPDARQYPVDDAKNTLEVALAQAGHLPNVGMHQWPRGTRTVDGARCARCGLGLADAHGMHSRGEDWSRCVATWRRRNLHALSEQAYAAWCLHLGAAWGFRTDPVATEILAGCVERERVAGRPKFLELGYLKTEVKKGEEETSRDMAAIRRAVAIAYGCSGSCAACGGRGRVGIEFYKADPTREKKGSGRTCVACNGTGLDLATAEVPRSDPSEKHEAGQVSTGRDVLFESGDEDLMDFAEYQQDDKIVETYVPALREGFEVPWTLRPNVLLETLRCSYSGKAQTMPRNLSARLIEALRKEAERLWREGRGDVYVPRGVRDCVVARPGHGIFSVDFKGGELVTFGTSAKRRIGFSRMGEALARGLDGHVCLAAQMLGQHYADTYAAYKNKDKRAKDIRQCAKWGNFGFLGGMKEIKFVLTQRRQGDDTPHPTGPSRVWDGQEFVPGYKGFRLCIPVLGEKRCSAVRITTYKDRPCRPVCRACVEAAKTIREAFLKTWPEAQPYLDWHAKNAEEVGEVVLPGSGVVRGGADYNAEANGDFQSLLAVISKRSLIRVVTESYTDRSSVLFGAHVICFLHDELLGEAPLDVLPEVATRVKVIMREEFRAACPEFADACDAEEAIAERWSKGMEHLKDDAGRLKLWTPKPWKFDRGNTAPLAAVG